MTITHTTTQTATTTTCAGNGEEDDETDDIEGAGQPWSEEGKEGDDTFWCPCFLGWCAIFLQNKTKKKIKVASFAVRGVCFRSNSGHKVRVCMCVGTTPSLINHPEEP